MSIPAKKLSILVFVIGICALLGFGLSVALKISLETSLVISGLAFCGLLALINFFTIGSIQKKQNSRTTDNTEFEKNLLSRMQQLEVSSFTDNQLETIDDRLTMLEERILDKFSEPLIIANTDEKHPHFEDGNIVHLNANRISRQSNPAGQSKHTKTSGELIKHILNEGQLTIRLQPILGMIEKEVLAVEAFGFFKLNEEIIDARELSSSFSQQQCGDYDLAVISALSKVVRSMEDDNQLLPIHFAFTSSPVNPNVSWEKIVNHLKADTKLGSMLVPQISAKIFKRLDTAQKAELFNLREFGSTPCLQFDEKMAGSAIRLLGGKNQLNFDIVKFAAGSLLKYLPNSEQRMIEMIMPLLADTGTLLIANELDAPEDATNLVDYDLLYGQGNFFSPPRQIKLYKDSA